ncbi:MAG: hypothetical protein ABMA14_02815 [Hyphomonadaceae bacterium]
MRILIPCLTSVFTSWFLLSGCVSSAAAQKVEIVLPGLLDLPLAVGQKVEQATSYPFRFASIEAQNPSLSEIRMDSYLSLLRTRGWIERASEYGDTLVLSRGEGDTEQCVAASSGLVIPTEGFRPPYYSIRFQQRSCTSERFIFPDQVDLSIVPGNWLDFQSTSLARIITTEGFRERMFDVYVAGLKEMAWRIAESEASAAVMQQSPSGPCLGIRHYKSEETQLNLIEFRFEPLPRLCSIRSMRENTQRLLGSPDRDETQ